MDNIYIYILYIVYIYYISNKIALKKHNLENYSLMNYPRFQRGTHYFGDYGGLVKT